MKIPNMHWARFSYFSIARFKTKFPSRSNHRHERSNPFRFSFHDPVERCSLKESANVNRSKLANRSGFCFCVYTHTHTSFFFFPFRSFRRWSGEIVRENKRDKMDGTRDRFRRAHAIKTIEPVAFANGTRCARLLFPWLTDATVN